MAIVKATALVASALMEAASLVWMELAMFGLAALVYVLYIGVYPRLTGKVPKIDRTKGCRADAQSPFSGHAARGDHQAVVRLWERARSKDEVSPVDLALVVDAKRKLGSSVLDVTAELDSAINENPKLVASITGLLGALLRDDAVDMLDAMLVLLEKKGCSADASAYAGLMAAQLRRRDHVGVTTTAARLPAETLTPRMRAMLAASAAHRSRLDEALGHLRQMPEPVEGAKGVLPASAVAQIISLSASQQRVRAAAHELQRIHARLDTKHFEEVLIAEDRDPAACRELLDAAAVLAVPANPIAYRVMAGALARAADAPGLHELMEELEGEKTKGTEGVALSEPIGLALLDACRSVRDGRLALRALALHRDACAGAPSGKLLSAACHALLACDDKQGACDLYEGDMLSKGMAPDVGLTNALLKAAATLGRTELAQRLSDHAGSIRSTQGSTGGSNSDLQRHATMIKAYARERNLKSAEEVFRRLQASGATLSPLVYNCFLDACFQCGDLQRGASHFEDMKRLGFIDVVGYNTMIKAFLGQGKAEEARRLVKEMGACGLQANKVTYNELLHARVLAKDRRGMWSIVDEMQEAGVRANPVTCSILLKSLTAQAGAADVRRVIALIEEVEEAIDEVLFSSVIEACIRIKQLDLLSDLMRRYRLRGAFVSLAAPTYGSMIKAYGQAGDIARVRELWQEMEEQGVKPTSITLGCLTEALVTNGHADEAWDLVHAQLESEERRSSVNTVIYSTVLKGFAVTRRMDKVFSVYQEMRAKAIPCNTITYNTLLDACAKSFAMSRASGLLEDMAESCVEPDIITYSTIIKGYCAEGDLERAFHILEDMKQDNKFSPDEIMYNSILDGCAKQHRVDDAMKMLEEMRSSGISPSNYTLSILVKCLGHARRLNQAVRMVEDLSSQNNFRPNVQVYTCLVQACILNRRLEKALSLYETMVSEECRIDEKFYAVLARGCTQLHQPLKAVEVVRAAYQLPGHSLACTRGRPIGVEARALEDVVARLQGGAKEEKEALAQLTADLEARGVRIGEPAAGGQERRRQPGNGRRGGY